MSYARGWSALNLDKPPEIPRTEYLFHPQYVRCLTGLDPDDPSQADDAHRATGRLLDYDFVWLTRNRPKDLGRHTWMGTAQYAPDQQDFSAARRGYDSVDDILAMSPQEEYALPDWRAQIPVYQETLDRWRSLYPDAVVPGGIYNSVFTWCILAFGWEMFMEASLADPQRFDEILEGFLQISLEDVHAWMETDCEVFLCHDDLVWSAGPVFHPDWYRRHIFPRYEALWEPLKAAGKKVLFCSDGNFDLLVDDLVAVGADGFIFEPHTSLDYLATNYGQTHVLIGNMDCRIIGRGPRAAIEAEIRRCWELGRDLPGYFFAVGNHLPYNLPVDHVHTYMDLLADYRHR